MTTRISGVQCLVMTPFTAQHEIDEEGLCNGIDFALDGGVDGIVVIGRVGEYNGLTMAERKRTIDVAKTHIAGRAPLGFGVMDATYDEGLELAHYGAQTGVDYVLSRGAIDQNPVEYFAALSSELPTAIYDYAEERELSTEEVLPILEECDDLVAIKITGQLEKIAELKEHTDLPLLCGWDTRSFLAYRFGAHGVVSGSAAVFPKHEVELCRLCMAERWDDAANLFYGRILPCLHHCVSFPYSAAAFKTVLTWHGVIKNPRTRERPYLPLNEIRRSELRRAVDWAGMLE